MSKLPRAVNVVRLVNDEAISPLALISPLAVMFPAIIPPLKVCVSAAVSPNIFEPSVIIVDDVTNDDVK